MSREKVEPIDALISFGNEDKLTVQKSLPLFSLWRSNLTLVEFKILDTYLSRIDSHNPDRRLVRFKKGELENILGVEKINIADLRKRLDNLQNTKVKLQVLNEEVEAYPSINLFEYSCPIRDKSGLWQVDLKCTESAIKYIFNIEQLGYIRYKLRCITNITSRYTYVLFLYLEQNRYRKSWEISLEDLKAMLSCEKEKTYKEYKNFNRLILKKVQKELNEKTECKFSYEPIRIGRAVAKIRFTVETLSNLEESEDSNQITIEEYLEAQDRASEKKLELWQEPIQNFGFTPEEYAELRSILYSIPESKLPEVNTAPGNLDIMRYHYMDMKAKEIIRRDKSKPIRAKYSYLLKMVKQDLA